MRETTIKALLVNPVKMEIKEIALPVVKKFFEGALGCTNSMLKHLPSEPNDDILYDADIVEKFGIATTRFCNGEENEYFDIIGACLIVGRERTDHTLTAEDIEALKESIVFLS